MRGVRGAISVTANTPAAIAEATHELLATLAARNGFAPADLAGAIFTATADLDAAYPAVTARTLGWERVPMLCVQEQAVAGSLPRCLRVLLWWNTRRSQRAIRHAYLRDAARLRPDLVEEPT